MHGKSEEETSCGRRCLTEVSPLDESLAENIFLPEVIHRKRAAVVRRSFLRQIARICKQLVVDASARLVNKTNFDFKLKFTRVTGLSKVLRLVSTATLIHFAFWKKNCKPEACQMHATLQES